MESDGVTTFCFGDVSGKGISAAVSATVIVNAFTKLYSENQTMPPGSAAATLNQQTYDFLTRTSTFSTFCVAQVSNQGMTIANCGHSPVMVLLKDWEPAKPHSPPLGVLEEISDSNVHYKPDEAHGLLIASDGYVEQSDQSGEMLCLLYTSDAADE